ncbi:Ionotropic receptor 272 [Blattella germanica]|nr:Ionotropic receptor 272 [Blattella germanica]
MPNIKVMFLLFYIWTLSSSKLTHFEENLIEEYLAECIINISSRYFVDDKPVLVATPINLYPGRYPYLKYGGKLIEMLQKENKFSLIIYGAEAYLGKLRVRVGSYIVLLPPILRPLDELYVKGMFRGINAFAYNFRGKTIVASVEQDTSSDNEKLQPIKVLKYAFEFEQPNTILLEPRSKSNKYNRKYLDKIYIYNWSPNEQSNICSYNIDKINHSDTWISRKRRFLFNTNLFPTYGNINFKGCKLILEVGNQPPFAFIEYSEDMIFGTVLNLFDYIKEYINCTVVYIIRQYQNTYPFIIHIDYLTPLDPINYAKDVVPDKLIYPYMRHEITWHVPIGAKKSRWMSLVKTFSAFVWSLVLITFVFGSFTMWLLGRSARLDAGVKDEINYGILADAMLTHLGVGVTYRHKGFIAGTFFMLWLYYCLVINTAYQSAFYGLLINPGSIPPLETIKEVEKSDLVKVITSVYPASLFWSRFMKYKFCSDAELCINQIAVKQTKAILINKWMGKFYHRSYNDLKYVPIKEIVGTQLLSIQVFKLHCILFSVLNKVLGRFTNAGILDHMTEKYTRGYLHNTPLTKTEFSLSMDHLQVAFYLLLIGCMLSLSLNVIEFCVHFIINWFYLLRIRYYLSIIRLI